MITLLENQYNLLSSMPIAGYFDMIHSNLMQQCTVTKNWSVPRLYKFYFQLLMQGDKSTICEHDIFCFIQELDGAAPSNGKKVAKSKVSASGEPEVDPKLAKIIDVDLIKKFRHDDSSIFTQAFVDDCILIFREMKRRPKPRKTRNMSQVQKS